MDPKAPIILRSSTECPVCHARHVVDIHWSLVAKPLGTFSLAGAQTKVSASEAWAYTCTACGATGLVEAFAPVETIVVLDVASCGHRVAAAHYASGVHVADVCPGCCPECQTIKDGRRADNDTGH